MKFEKFDKKIGAHGTLAKGHGYSFLVSGNVAAVIPDFALNFYQITKADELTLLSEVFDNFDVDELNEKTVNYLVVIKNQDVVGVIFQEII